MTSTLEVPKPGPRKAVPKPVTSAIVDITPQQASLWLKKNTRNRRVRETRVEELTDAIERGEWALDGSPIRFSTDGQVLDGQHRLLAIARAGKSVKSLVVRNLQASAQDVMDTGARRSFADVLTIEGEANAAALAAACNVMWRYENGRLGTRSVQAKPSFGQLKDVLNRHGELRTAARASMTSRKKIRLAPGHLTAAFVILRLIDETEADYFFATLLDGAGLAETDAIFQLREQLNQNAMRRNGKYSADYLLAILFKAWNRWRRAEEVKILAWRAGGSAPEPFPLPE